MDFKTCIKIRRRGANYYTTFMGRALNRVFSSYGYHIVKNPMHYEHCINVIFDFSPWMTVASKELDRLELAVLQKLAADLSIEFKAITVIEPFQIEKVESILPFYFSSKYNAFEEPPYIKDGPTLLKMHMCPADIYSGQPFLISFLNYGGISKGLELFISGKFVENNTADLEPNIFMYDHKNRDRYTFNSEKQKIIQEDGSMGYFYDFSDFIFPAGINEFSAVRGKKTMNDLQINLRMLPIGKQQDLDSIIIKINPKGNKDNVIIWSHEEMQKYKEQVFSSD